MAKAKDNPITPPDNDWKLTALFDLASRMERRRTSAIVKMGSPHFWRLWFPDPRNPRSVAKKNRTVLKDNAELLDEPLKRLHGVLDDNGKMDLLAVMLACVHIGRIDDPDLEYRLVKLEKGREGHAEQRKRGRELALKHAADARKKHPERFKSNRSTAEHITPQVVAEMQTLYPGYRIDVSTVRKWLANK